MDSKLLNSVESYVHEVWEDVVADIATLVEHPSVADVTAGEQGAPFGKPVREALDAALSIAQRLGYHVSDDEGYVGMAEIPGELTKQIATIAHVDVVPAGPGWNTNPFKMERREGWLLGRGVIDDKGPAVLSLYAGAYLLKQGIKPRYTFRALLGCDEEVGMSDVHHYLDTHESPAFLFTPDAEFPVCNAEKGCYGATFTSAVIEGGIIRSWSGAEATNAIPSESVCVLDVALDKLPAPVAHANRVTLSAEGEGATRIFAQGIGGHASMPEDTINAIALVVDYLQEVAKVQPELFATAELDFLNLLSTVHEGTDGAGLGIATQSDAFGPLTCNAGTIEVANNRIVQTIDVRYPDSITGDEMTMICGAVASQYNAEFELSRDKEPFSVSAESSAVQTLLDIYRKVTGRPAKPFAMGGGTYARNFTSAVSFGPEDSLVELPEWAGTMHGPNEAANEQLLKDALKMYILAILRLNELDL